MAATSPTPVLDDAAPPPAPAMSPSRALINRLRWWWQGALGWPGAAALAMAVAAAVLAFVVRPSIEAERQDQFRAQVRRIEAGARARPAAAAPAVDPRDAWRAALPAWNQRSQVLAKLLKLRVPLQIGMESAEYTAIEVAPQLMRLQVNLPLVASYAQTRALVAAILNDFPFASVDALEAQQDAPGGGALTGRIRLSFYFRQEGT